jgi:hypothetical protein
MNSFYNRESGSETARSDRFMYIDVPKPGNIYIKVRGPAEQLYVKSTDHVMRSDIHYNYYGLEVTHMEQSKIFHEINPGKFGMEFTGS